ncbi:hypothetical protein LIA77_11740 [Sarocladium implicatum]|nr:hypothetical protein LIA77_11740 [Sarocladium implicatum]
MSHSNSPHDSYLGGLSEMRNLRRLRINGTCIEDLMAKSQDAPLFPSSLAYLEISLTRLPRAVCLQLEHWAPKCREDCPSLERVDLCGSLQEIRDSWASNLSTFFRHAQVASDFVEDADLDGLLRAHKRDSGGVMWNHDYPPGWEFWNPYVEPMALADQTEYFDSG